MVTVKDLKEDILNIIIGADWEIVASCRDYEITEHSLEDEDTVAREIITSVLEKLLPDFMQQLLDNGCFDDGCLDEQTAFRREINTFIEYITKLCGQKA